MEEIIIDSKSKIALKFYIYYKVGLNRNEKLIKVFTTRLDPKYAKAELTNYTYKNDIKQTRYYLSDNEKLKVISETKCIQFESNKFLEHLKYLEKNKKLIFLCLKCLKQNKKNTLPKTTYENFGTCEECKKTEQVSCSALNLWLQKNKYNLFLKDRSRFIRPLMPQPQLIKNVDIPPVEKINFLHIKNKISTENTINIQTDEAPEEVFDIWLKNRIKSQSFQKKETPPLTAEEIYQKKQELTIKNVPQTIEYVDKSIVNIEKKQIKNKKNNTFSFDGLLGVIFILFSLFFFISLFSGFFYELPKADNKTYTISVKIIAKEKYLNKITFISKQKIIYKTQQNYKFWYAGEIGDSVLITFKDWNNPEFLNVTPLKNNKLKLEEKLYK